MLGSGPPLNATLVVQPEAGGSLPSFPQLLLGEKTDTPSLFQKIALANVAIASFLVGWRPLVTEGGNERRGA